MILEQSSLVSYLQVYDYDAILFSNMSLVEREARHQNLLSYNDDFDLDVPEADIVKYRATLAHKANHAFEPNVKFCYAKHPRFKWLKLDMT